MSPSYGEILNIAPLLKLQEPLSSGNHHDELQYVIVHQESELWFKLLLHELEAVREGMIHDDLALAARVDRALQAMYAGGAHPALREISEELTALDNQLLLWRTHHAIMAERAIGSKVGTGGEGVEDLYRTARIRCFPELMALRSIL